MNEKIIIVEVEHDLIKIAENCKKVMKILLKIFIGLTKWVLFGNQTNGLH